MIVMPFDHAHFTEDVRELVAENDRVPVQREPVVEKGQRIHLPNFDGGVIAVVDEVSDPDEHGAVVLTVRVSGDDERMSG